MNKIIETRRSIRKYNDLVISDEDMMDIIHAACMAPSAKNQQPWKFKIVNDKKVLQEISDNFINIKFAKDASHAVLFILDKSNLLTEPMAPQDMGSCITCALLEARDLGIGSCWCGVYPREERIELARKVFNLYEENLVPFSIVIFGYPENKDDFKIVERDYLDRIIK